MFTMEQECIDDLDDRIKKIEAGTMSISTLANIMKECVNAEITQYILGSEMVFFRN